MPRQPAGPGALQGQQTRLNRGARHDRQNVPSPRERDRRLSGRILPTIDRVELRLGADGTFRLIKSPMRLPAPSEDSRRLATATCGRAADHDQRRFLSVLRPPASQPSGRRPLGYRADDSQEGIDAGDGVTLDFQPVIRPVYRQNGPARCSHDLAQDALVA